MIVATSDSRLVRHLAHAIAEHLKWCRRNAVQPPRELSELLAALTDPDGHERSSVPDGEPVSDGVCVNYQTAGRMLGVSERTVRRMTRDGRLHPVPVGRRRLIVVDEIRRLADGA